MNNVNKPSHYQLEGLEPYESIDVIRAVLGDKVKYFYIGNILKYTIRAEKKNGLEDYKKASVYLNWLIEWESLTEEEKEQGLVTSQDFEKVEPGFLLLNEWESLKGSANEMSYEELNIEFINSKITEIQNDINKHCMNKMLDIDTDELLNKIFDGVEELRVKEGQEDEKERII